MTDGLKDRHRDAIIAVLAAEERVERAVLFGSRATGTFSPASDVDIALFGDRLTSAHCAALAGAMEELTVPQRVDLLLHREIESAALLAHIARQGVEWYRQRAGTALGECIAVNSATYSPKEEWPFVNYLDTGSITENRIHDIQTLVAGQDKIPSRARRKCRPGDIVYSTVRPNQRHFGLLRETPDNFLVSTGFAVIRGRVGVAHTPFIYWFLTQDHIVEYLHSIAEDSTSAYPSIKPTDLEQLAIDLPPLREQRRIADVLGALDDKIEANRRMNETLEAMAQAIFRDWFVDFGPVRAKMEGRAPYLPPDLWDLFPDRLVDSELGPIPNGWKVVALGDVADVTKGRSYKSSELSDSDVALVTLKSIKRGGGYSTDGLKPYVGKFNESQIVESGSIVVAQTDVTQNAEVIGRTARIMDSREHRVLVASLDLLIVEPAPPLTSPYLYHLLQDHGFHAHALGRVNGTTVLHMQRNTVQEYAFPMPPAGAICHFTTRIEEYIAQHDLSHAESDVLATLREALLPKLMSGELRVSPGPPPESAPAPA